ncbi:hypothetical protein ACWD00_31425 [Streptomyces viridiviolaceus]
MPTTSPTTRKRRVLMLAASTALAAGGALVPTGAFAAPATPHAAAAITADWDDHEDRDWDDRDHEDGDWDDRDHEDRDSTDEGPESTEDTETTPESGVVPESYCSDPMRAPGLCVDGKPLPKGDGTVTVPQGILVPSPTGSPTARLAV